MLKRLRVLGLVLSCIFFPHLAEGADIQWPPPPQKSLLRPKILSSSAGLWIAEHFHDQVKAYQGAAEAYRNDLDKLLKLAREKAASGSISASDLTSHESQYDALMSEYKALFGKTDESTKAVYDNLISQYKQENKRLKRLGYSTIRVYVATDRARTPSGEFASVPSSPRQLTFVSYNVTIPNENRGPGEIAACENAVTEELKRSYFTVSPPYTYSMQEAMLSDIASHAKDAGTDDAFLYVHGFNTKYFDAIRQAAQLSRDMCTVGPVVLYTWPSRGSWYDYDEDAISSRGSEYVFASWLRHLAETMKSLRLSLLVHSMGHRIVLPALVDLVKTHWSTSGYKLASLLCSAPDVEVNDFRLYSMARLHEAAELVTEYVSKGDKALAAGFKADNKERAGRTILPIAGVDQVDVSMCPPDFMDHSHFWQREVVRDLIGVVTGQASPKSRGLYRCTASWDDDTGDPVRYFKLYDDGKPEASFRVETFGHWR